jgi:transposase
MRSFLFCEKDRAASPKTAIRDRWFGVMKPYASHHRTWWISSSCSWASERRSSSLLTCLGRGRRKSSGASAYRSIGIQEGQPAGELREDLVLLDQRIVIVTREIEGLATRDDYPQHRSLAATTLLAAVGDGRQFRRAHDLAAWLGFVPREFSTGGNTTLLGISRHGNRYVTSIHTRRRRCLGCFFMPHPRKFARFALAQWHHIGCWHGHDR